jgi:hypothetical protein
MFAGAAAAILWAASEPALRALYRTNYSELRLLGGLTGRGPTAALMLHAGNGALFGALFERLGGRGVLGGMLAAEAENVGLWPLMAMVDRVHPDRRSGAWPPLLLNKTVFAYEATGHALFGAVLGALIRSRDTA